MQPDDPPTAVDVLSPHEVARRAGFSYHAILRAIRRGDLQAYEPIPGRYRIEIADYERWLHQPVHRNSADDQTPARRRSRRPTSTSDRGSLARLRALEGSG